METKLFQEYPVGKRAEMLESNAESVEEMTYSKSLMPEEIEKVRIDFAQKAIEINSKEEEFKEVSEEFHRELKPIKKEFKESLQVIKTRQKEVTEKVYILKDFKEGMLGIYNCQGDLISSRRLTSEEMQLSINTNLRVVNQ